MISKSEVEEIITELDYALYMMGEDDRMCEYCYTIFRPDGHPMICYCQRDE